MATTSGRGAGRSSLSANPFRSGGNWIEYYRVVASSACTGAVDSLAGVPDKLWPGFRITGWAWDIAAHAPGRAVVLTDLSGRIIGAAWNRIWRPDVPAAIPSFHRDDAGYLGYVPADLQSPSAEIFVILADNISGCRLSGPPLALPLATTAYSGPAATGVTRNMVRYRAPAPGHIDTLNGQFNRWKTAAPRNRQGRTVEDRGLGLGSNAAGRCRCGYIGGRRASGSSIRDRPAGPRRNATVFRCPPWRFHSNSAGTGPGASLDCDPGGVPR